MIRETPWPAGIPCWADLATTDFEGVRAAYACAFGWQIPDGDPAMGGYAVATRDGNETVGLTPTMSPDQPSAWNLYIASGDIASTAAAITANGGSILVGPMEVPDAVHMLLATDPQGGTFGVIQEINHNPQLTGAPGGIAWEHCAQPDPEAGKAFYGAVFGWVFQPLPGIDGAFTFTSRAGEPPYGSMGRIGPPAPAGWQVTFGAESTDAVVKTFEAAGGFTVVPASDTPWGRMATITDAAGATFSVMETAGNPEPTRAFGLPPQTSS